MRPTKFGCRKTCDFSKFLGTAPVVVPDKIPLYEDLIFCFLLLFSVTAKL